MPELPVVVGEVFDNGKRDSVRAAIQAIAAESPTVGLVSSEGTTTSDAGTHFDAKSQLLLGARYATAMNELRNPKREEGTAAPAYPEFSWDRIPLYMHVRKARSYTDEGDRVPGQVSADHLRESQRPSGPRLRRSRDFEGGSGGEADQPEYDDPLLPQRHGPLRRLCGRQGTGQIPGAMLRDQSGNTKLVRDRVRGLRPVQRGSAHMVGELLQQHDRGSRHRRHLPRRQHQGLGAGHISPGRSARPKRSRRWLATTR